LKKFIKPADNSCRA